MRIDVLFEVRSFVYIDDDVYNYLISFLRLSMDLMLFYYVIKVGYIDRLMVLMKCFIFLFIGLIFFRLKYVIECVNFFIKIEYIFLEFESVRVKLCVFVNVYGKFGKNKVVDM